ncbi:MAG: helix-turn-helix transcriptional regulator [Pedobacter sp.]|uniref:helix-turn-helix domain-containing protein n=1 Tax=Pedobacter sp. TaxID=1411316 RepID=UPI002808AF23|nr:helix-turn-helix transcriptional regulator [Pedobacter sp.]MDQ8003773.1 helix-turn-helix transcriptional regulator [Pedobacter sp.]
MKKEAGIVIKAIRLRLGYKQEYVAQKINISASLLGHIENGRVGLDIDKLYLLANLYHVLPRNILEIAIELYKNKTEDGLDRAISYITTK